MDIVTEAIREFVNGALGVNFREMMIQIASTLVLFIVVRFYFWNHITEYLQKRQDAMDQAYNEAESTQKEADQIKKEAEKALEETKMSAKQTLEEAKSRGKQKEQEIVQTAKANAATIKKNAEAEVDRLYEQAKGSMEEEIVSVATIMAEKIIQKELDEKKYKALLKEATDEVTS
jgi:F-type H+-transporting ATPase subunit b